VFLRALLPAGSETGSHPQTPLVCLHGYLAAAAHLRQFIICGRKVDGTGIDGRRRSYTG